MAAKKRPGLAARVGESIAYILGARESLDYFAKTVGRGEDAGFRRVTAKSEKELTEFEWRKQMAVAYYLWAQNPMAHRIVELITDFVVGDGFLVQAKDPAVQRVLDAHWSDPDNAWDLKQFERAQELGLFGLLALRAFVNDQNGHVKLSPVDPVWITGIVPHPERAGEADILHVSVGGRSPETWRVVGRDEDPASKTHGLLTGEAFYFAVNKLSYTLRGFSDIFRVADFLDANDQFIFKSMERIEFLNAHLYDITIDGATEDVVKARAADLEMNPPRAGGFRIHNEKEKWNDLSPKLNSAEIEEISRLVKMFVLGSLGIPEHWFAEGGNVNRASAAEMGTPIFRKLKRRQAQWRDMIHTVLDFVVDQAVAHGRLPAGVDKEFAVVPPDISTKDVAGLSTSLQALTTALVTAQDAGYVTREKAAEIWSANASELGVDIAPPTELERAKDDADKRATAEQRAEEVEQGPYVRRAAAGAPVGAAPDS